MAGLLDYLPGYTRSQADFNRRVGQPVGANLLEFIDGAPVVGGIKRAVDNPSIGTISNAGVETLFAGGKPLAALKLLAGAYGTAGAKDLGLLDGVSDAQAKKDKKGGMVVAKLPGLSDEDNATYQGIMARLSAGDFSSGAERRALESQAKIFTDKSTVAGTKEAELSAAKDAADKAEFDRQVSRAEAARDVARSKDRRFSSNEVGKVWDATGGFAPLAIGALFGGIGRAASGGGSTAKNYTMPAAVGGLTGAAASNIPLAYNAFMTEPDNPETVAAEAYARELPDSHPKKQAAMEYATRMRREQPTNPVRDAAAAELYNPIKAGERMGFGALEGIGGGLLGADLARLPGRVVEGVAGLGPRYERAYYEGLADTQKAKNALPGSAQPALPGNAQQPAGGLLPPAAPSAPQALLPPPAPQMPGQRAQSYGVRQQSVARPLIDSDVAVGGSVPSANALENAYQAAGVKAPTTKKYTAMLNTTQKLVSEMQAKGMSGPEIVKALQALRANGTPILGLGAATLAGAGLMDFEGGGN